MGQGGGIGRGLSPDIVVTQRSNALTPPGFITVGWSPADPPTEPDPGNTFEVGTGAHDLGCGCRVTDWQVGTAPMSVERDILRCPVHYRRCRDRILERDAEVAEHVRTLLEPTAKAAQSMDRLGVKR